MAGAGYKLFATGDVLTAAQVNTYLMQQTVMVFASSAARTSALSGVLAEGMVSYLQDTNSLEVYDGSAWIGATGDLTALTAGTGISITNPTGPVPTVAIDTAVTADLTTAQTLTNKTLTSPVLTTPSISNINAKGDILVGTADNTLGVITAGSNGETLVADSTATTGLRWQGNYAAGKNAIINGDFGINQRAFTSTTTTATYGFDRWRLNLSGATGTYSAQTFTLGEAPVAGYESKNFARLAVTVGNDTCELMQRIEGVRTFANQTVTVSFWAKGTNPATDGGLYVNLNQSFGTGGSPSAQVNSTPSKFVLTANWTRYSATFNVPSISGKTLGTNNDDFLFVTFGQGAPVSTESWTLDIWGVQVEAGSTATPFQTATGTKQGELAACQRYYYRLNSPGAFTAMCTGMAFSATASQVLAIFPVPMRTKPTALEQSGTAGDYATQRANSSVDACTAVPVYALSSIQSGTVTLASANLVAGNATQLLDNNKAANVAYLAWSAEL
jgi:hypothetical protein